MLEDADSARLQLPGSIVLDRSDDRVLLGRPEPIIPGSDADRVLILTAGDPSLDGQRVLDARFAADAIVVLGADHVLYAHRGGRVVELDRAAEAPLSVAGSTVVYARGEMPFFEIVRADVIDGTARALTQGMAPAWSPAVSASGDVVFASSVSGRPRLYRIRGGTVGPLPESRTPSSPIAPRLDGDHLAFDDEQGSTVVDLSTGLEVAQ